MKRYFSTALLLLFAVLLIPSCAKEVLETPPSEVREQTKPLTSTPSGCESLLNSITHQNGMLVFQSFEDFIEAQTCLTNLREERNDAFEAQYPTYTPAELDSVADSTGFLENGVLVDFESQLNFVSLRQQMQAEIDLWLEQDADDLDWATFPADKYVVGDEFLTLLNADGKAKIGNSVVDFLSGSYSIMNPASANGRLGVCVLADCCYLGSTIGTIQVSNNERIRLYIQIASPSGFAYSFVRSGVAYYRRVGRRFWPARARMNTAFAGNPRRGNCDTLGFNFGSVSPTRTRSVITTTRHHWGFPLHAMNRDFITDANVNQHSESMFLVW